MQINLIHKCQYRIRNHSLHYLCHQNNHSPNIGDRSRHTDTLQHVEFP